MRSYPKNIRKELAKWASIAHDRELSMALDGLANDFDRWKAGQISSFDLSDLIHGFHEHTAVDIWKKYSGNDHDLAVAGAIVHGILDRTELPYEVLEAIGRILAFAESLS